MRFGHIELFVAEPLESMTFYRDILGFSVTTIQADKYVWLQLGSQELLLRPIDGLIDSNRASAYEQTAIGLVLYSDNVAVTVSKLQARGIDFVPLPDGCVSFADPDGHWYQLVNPEHG